jgi:glyoxylase-like metal-dependent hydrolase (beta-lactamase superfamily II)
VALTRAFTVGNLKCHTLEAGLQRLDGGAMFGVVPKPLWERQIAPDERNRIPLAMRCLLVEHPDGLVLIDTGAGNKDDAKFRDIYGIENTGVRGATQLEDALAAAGFSPGDVKLVINTHLHFDHAGGNTLVGEPGGPEHADQADGFAPDQSPAAVLPRLAFPNATYCVQRGELEFARHTNERTRASYLPPNFEPVATAGRWRLLDGDVDVVPGISVRVTPGHVPWHQVVLVKDRGETSAFVGDLLATASHLPLPYIMGYDLEPLRTLESKRSFLRDALTGSWRVVFEHDAKVAWGWLVQQGKGLALKDAQAAG